MALAVPTQKQPAGAPADGALALLSGMAVALGHGLDVDVLLSDLAAGIRRTLDADRVSVLLLDDAGRLTPAVAVAREHDAEMWQRFRRMPPIALDGLPGAREAMAEGRVLVVDDARRSPLIPRPWQQAFELGTLALAPLRVGHTPAGVLVVDHVGRLEPFTPTQVTLLEGMAALAGVALKGVQERADAHRSRRLADAVSAIAGARTTRAVAEHTLAALLDTVGERHGLFALPAQEAVEVVAVRGAGLPEPGRYPLDLIAADVVDRCAASWRSAAHRTPVAAVVGGNPLTLVPVPSAGRLSGIAVLPVAYADVPEQVQAEIAVIADSAGAVLRATGATAEREWLRRAVTLASDDGRDLTAQVAAVRELLASDGVRLTDVVAADRPAARATGLVVAAGDVARAVARWRRSPQRAEAVALGDDIAVPLVAGQRLLGAVVVGDGFHAHAADHLDALAHILAQHVARQLDAANADELAHASANADAHRAVAARCYAEAGQVLGLLAEQTAHDAAERRPAVGTRVLVDQARRLVRDAAASLSALPQRGPGLRTALVALAEQGHAHGGPQASVRQLGRVPALEPATQVAVLHAVRRLLVFLRQARVGLAWIQVEADDARVTVNVRSDGLLAHEIEADDAGLHAALREARAWLAVVDGAVEHSLDGAVNSFHVTAPAGLRRPERLTPVHRHEDSGEVVPLESARTRQS